jgi:hypothetical protein
MKRILMKDIVVGVQSDPLFTCTSMIFEKGKNRVLKKKPNKWGKKSIL